MTLKNPRLIATHILTDVIFNGLSLNRAFDKHLHHKRDQALIKEMCYGTLRWHPRLMFIAQQLLKNTVDHDVLALILIGLYQLMEMRIPAHAAVDETVSTTKDMKKARASSVVNAVLRNYQRQSAALSMSLQKNPVAFFAHPEWLLAELQQAWPKQWQDIVAANNAHPPFSLRVNLLQISRDSYLRQLAQHEMKAVVHAHNSSGLTLTTPIDVSQLPGFSAGEVSVQDEAAQFAATLLDVGFRHHVLDACAAPGGKTAHILESQPTLANLVAVEKDPERLKKVAENLHRLHLNATLVEGDATKPDTWWDQQLFDRILVDAPCSATGIIRRRPDIKIHRRPSDIESLAKQQLQLLESLWPLLAPGGMLVYATCSILPQENEHVVRAFMSLHQDAVEKPINAEWGEAVAVGRQILPSVNGMDGFYYARLEKIRT